MDATLLLLNICQWITSKTLVFCIAYYNLTRARSFNINKLNKTIIQHLSLFYSY